MGIIKGVYSERCHIYFYCCITVSAFYMHQYSYITVEEFICFSINWTTVYWPDLSRISDLDSVEHRRIWSVYGGSHIRTNRYLTENVSECQDFETRFVLHSDKYIFRINFNFLSSFVDKDELLTICSNLWFSSKPNSYNFEMIRMSNTSKGK